MDRLNEIENEIKQLQARIELLNAEKSRLLGEQKEKKFIENWQNLQNQVRNLKEEQIYSADLNIETKTVPLFDSFYKQPKPYLKLGFTHFEYPTMYSILGVFYKKRYICIPVSLILVKDWNAIRRNHRTLTATELKKNINQLNPMSNNRDLCRLFEEINGTPRQEFEDCIKNNKPFERKYYPLSKPISIGAQINKNLEGFGNEYCGNELVYEGTKYGETTEFLIVGICVDEAF